MLNLKLSNGKLFNLETVFFFKQFFILNTIFFVFSSVTVVFSITNILAEDATFVFPTFELFFSSITVIWGCLCSTFSRIWMDIEKISTNLIQVSIVIYPCGRRFFRFISYLKDFEQYILLWMSNIN